MGVGDWIRDKVTPQFVKDVDKALTSGAPPPPAEAKTPSEAKTPQQLQYEAKEKWMNRNNPYYQGPSGNPVPRAKGGCVKAGGEPIKVMKVGESVKTEPMKVKGNP